MRDWILALEDVARAEDEVLVLRERHLGVLRMRVGRAERSAPARLAAAVANSASADGLFGAQFGFCQPFAQPGVPQNVSTMSIPRACSPASRASAELQS